MGVCLGCFGTKGGEKGKEIGGLCGKGRRHDGLVPVVYIYDYGPVTHSQISSQKQDGNKCKWNQEQNGVDVLLPPASCANGRVTSTSSTTTTMCVFPCDGSGALHDVDTWWEGSYGGKGEHGHMGRLGDWGLSSAVLMCVSSRVWNNKCGGKEGVRG